VLVFVLVLMVLVLLLMEMVVGGSGHTDDQQHGLVEAELLVLVEIKVLHDLINGGLVLHVLQRKGQVGKLLLNQKLQLALGQGV
ncbi:hypothetical protein N331_06754, partial [Merops nubicus]